MKEKIYLTQEQETLLIPLYGRAMESRRATPILSDPKAQEILEQVDYDFSTLKVPQKTIITLCIRASMLDALARQFIAAHPHSLVLHLGCGLDGRYLRVSLGQVEWYDLDLPLVIDLRRKFYTESAQYHMIPSSVTDWDWMEQVSPAGRPVLVIAEGLLMYLKEEDVKTLFLKLGEKFPGCQFICDVYSSLTAEKANAHPSIKKTGAVIRWGIDDAKALENWGAGIHLREELYFAQAKEIERLGQVTRLLFKLAGRFTVVNKAHRVLYYDL